MESNARVWIAALRHSHERLLGLVGPLTPEQISGPSYCKDWTVAQVLSHLGSGAEIASTLLLPAALGQAQAPPRDAYQPIWDRWNAMSPDEQAAAGIMADAQYVSALDALTDDELASISYEFFGMQLDAVGLVRLRLGEHALHTWDVAVQYDKVAEVSPDAVRLLIDNVPAFLAPRLGKPQDPAFRARIRTADPDRDYLLTAGPETVIMGNWSKPVPEGQEVAEVAMPAAALLRLSYGRMDADHTPPEVSAKPAELDALRAIFPGF